MKNKKQRREQITAFLKGSISNTLMGRNHDPSYEDHRTIFVIGALYTNRNSYNLNELLRNTKSKSMKIYGEVPIKRDIERAIQDCIDQKLLVRQNGVYVQK